MAIGAIIGAGLVGASLYADKKNRENSNARFKWEKEQAALARQDTRYYYDQSADYSIQRRVRDAKRAGISGLAALGAPGQSMPSINIGQSPRASGANTNLLAALSALYEMNQRQKEHDDQMELIRMGHMERMAKAGGIDSGGVTLRPMDMGPENNSWKSIPANTNEVDNVGSRPNPEDRQWTQIYINGKIHYIRPGTDMQVLEDKLGEIGVFLESSRRGLTFYQDNDYLPSKNDIIRTIEDIGIFVRDKGRMKPADWKAFKDFFKPKRQQYPGRGRGYSR